MDFFLLQHMKLLPLSCPFDNQVLSVNPEEPESLGENLQEEIFETHLQTPS